MIWLRRSLAGKEAGQVYEGEQRFNLVVRLNENAGRDVDPIRNLLLTAEVRNSFRNTFSSLPNFLVK